MQEFMQGFLGSVIGKQMPPYLERKANDIYTPVDTVNQYLEQFAYFRKC
jgi:mediator of RNA polymerase II transcription subunit 20